MLDIANAFNGIALPGDEINREQANRLSLQNAQLQQQALVQAAQKAAQDQARLRAAEDKAIKGRTAQDYADLLVINPKAFEGIKQAHAGLQQAEQNASLQELSAIRGYLAAGKPQDAQRLIKRRIDADRAAGLPTDDDQAIFDLIGSAPDRAGGFVDYQLAGIMGPAEWSKAFEAQGKERRADAAAPVDLAKTVADTSLATAQTAAAPINAQANLLSAQAAATNATATTANTNSVIADRNFQREQTLQNGPPIPPTAAAAINSRIESAASSRQLAERATNLADRLAPEAAKLDAAGIFATTANGLGRLAGFAPSEMASMRQEYAALNITQAIKNLPPGPASDKDVKMAMKGFPPDNAPASQLLSYLRGVAKVQEFTADQSEKQADWMAANGGTLGPAKRPFMVGYDFIEPGTSYGAYQSKIFKDRAREQAQKNLAEPPPKPTRAMPNVKPSDLGTE